MSFTDKIAEINSVLNSFAWGPVMLILLVGTGIFLTVRFKWLQAGKFGYIMKRTFGTLFKKRDTADGNNITPFQAVTTALAATVGTGNIAGVTGAIFVGGPGAVFWMWISAFFGMCTKYAEICLAMRYRIRDDNGTYHGGPMYYIENGLGHKWKFLAVIFALLGTLASFGIGNIAQSSEISGACTDLFGMKGIFTGIILAVLVGLVILGGVKRIGKVTEYLVPFMAAFYILAGLAVIIIRITDIPAAFGSIFSQAFSLKSVGGGIFGYTMTLAMKNGFARGVFSNEAGLGSAPIAHASSSETDPCKQALWGVFEVFVDTIVICSITALTVILSGVTGQGLESFASKGAAAASAFNTILPGTLGGTVIQVSLLFFAFSTIIGWSHYGVTCLEYLTKGNKVISVIYKVLFLGMCIIGATGSGTLMWDISDTLNGFMAIPNLIALLLLSGTVVALTREYFARQSAELPEIK